MTAARSLALLLLLSALSGSPAAAAQIRPAAEQAKIDALLGRIAESNGTFIRNGKEYTAKKAVAHLASKLRRAGRRVQTARDFIAGIASRSLQSGKPYELRLPDGTRMPLRGWLEARLAEIEGNAK